MCWYLWKSSCHTCWRSLTVILYVCVLSYKMPSIRLIWVQNCILVLLPLSVIKRFLIFPFQHFERVAFQILVNCGKAACKKFFVMENVLRPSIEIIFEELKCFFYSIAVNNFCRAFIFFKSVTLYVCMKPYESNLSIFEVSRPCFNGLGLVSNMYGIGLIPMSTRVPTEILKTLERGPFVGQKWKVFLRLFMLSSPYWCPVELGTE